MTAARPAAVLPWFALALCAPASGASTEEARDAVEWVADADARCVQLGGTLTGVRNRDRSRTVRVWLDRWYLGVRTPDRGRYDLAPDAPAHALGCSETRQGPQHWTIEDAHFLDVPPATTEQRP